MVRSLLALALVAAQLQSWSGSALYLCLSDDGAVCCIDGGPESCDCCHRDDEHHGCPGHENESPTPASHDSGWQAALPCDCTHVLIVQTQAPAIRRASSTVEAAHAPVMDTPNAVASDVSCADFMGGLRPADFPALAPRALSVAVMRC